MKHTEVINKYLEGLRCHMSEKQAELFAVSWAEASEIHSEAATKQDLENLLVKIDSKFSIVIALGGAIFLACCLPVINKFFGG